MKKFFNFCIPFEIGADELFGRTVFDSELLRESKGLLSIDNPKVDRLGLGTHLRRHFFQGHAKDKGCCVGMDIFPVSKSFQECRIF